MTIPRGLGLLLSMASVLGNGVPYPEPSVYRSAETRRRSAPTPPPPVERTKTQRELDAEAKRARRRERNLCFAVKPAPAVVVLKSAGNYYIGVDFASTRPKSIDWEEVEPTAPLPWPEIETAEVAPWKLTQNQQALLTHLEGGYDRPVEEILAYFPTPQSARATISAATRYGLVEVLGVLIRITPLGIASLEHARYKAHNKE